MPAPAGTCPGRASGPRTRHQEDSSEDYGCRRRRRGLLDERDLNARLHDPLECLPEIHDTRVIVPGDDLVILDRRIGGPGSVSGFLNTEQEVQGGAPSWIGRLEQVAECDGVNAGLVAGR